MARFSMHLWTLIFCLAVSGLSSTHAAPPDDRVDRLEKQDLWSLRPLASTVVPQVGGAAGSSTESHPIDAFLERARQSHGLEAVPIADRPTLLRRVSFDLIGLPPTPEELAAFLADDAPQAYEKVVDRLLASEQHGVRYARHWLDVLRYADVDGRMRAESGIYQWRDWVIESLNADLPYDEFVVAQVAGDPADAPDRRRANGFLARGATEDSHDLAFAAVETISTAFLAMTVGCAKCHDHFYDPISQKDYYSMKALFDPLRLESLPVATPDQRARYAAETAIYNGRKRAIKEPMNALIAPFKKRLFQERVETLPPEVQKAIRKPSNERTPKEQKVASDYAPILRIDPPKIREIMNPEQVASYNDYRRRLSELKAPRALPVVWSVREDAARAAQKSFVLETGDPSRPQAEVEPGFPFAPRKVDFSGGRRQAFASWLTSGENPLFARVGVNRLWQWHFGAGLVSTASDFGALGSEPSHPELLDWLATEFISSGFSMKRVHRLIVTSTAYKLSSTPGDGVAADRELLTKNATLDVANIYLWRFPLRRLEAEPIRDALLYLAGELDLTVGGKSFRVFGEQRRLGGKAVIGNFDERQRRRAIYMARGYHADRELMPSFLEIFDAEDGRVSCDRRESSVTAPQALFMLNSELGESASHGLAGRLKEQTSDLGDVVDLAYRTVLCRSPMDSEKRSALDYLDGHHSRVAGLAWLLMNLDEFLYIR